MDLRDGVTYLAGNKGLLYPLLLTFAGIVLTGPSSSLLAAIVHSQGGSLDRFGLEALLVGAGLLALISLGALIGRFRAQQGG